MWLQRLWKSQSWTLKEKRERSSGVEKASDAEPNAEAGRGRHFDFTLYGGVPGGSGSLASSLGGLCGPSLEKIFLFAGAMPAWRHPKGAMTTFPTVDFSRTCLHRAGWSIGETATAAGWLATGSNGENSILAQGATQKEAWHRAVEQARAVGMLGFTEGVEPVGL